MALGLGPFEIAVILLSLAVPLGLLAYMLRKRR
jgi:hypothetical protein